MSTTPEAGHNSEQLRSIVARIETLEANKAEIASDIKDVYLESKGNGYCPKALRKIIAIRKKDPADRAEEAAILETYLHALGME